MRVFSFRVQIHRRRMKKGDEE
jgi:hypothetical protein